MSCSLWLLSSFALYLFCSQFGSDVSAYLDVVFFIFTSDGFHETSLIPKFISFSTFRKCVDITSSKKSRPVPALLSFWHSNYNILDLLILSYSLRLCSFLQFFIFVFFSGWIFYTDLSLNLLTLSWSFPI